MWKLDCDSCSLPLLRLETNVTLAEIRQIRCHRCGVINPTSAAVEVLTLQGVHKDPVKGRK
jgi:phage FluMu protein Com